MNASAADVLWLEVLNSDGVASSREARAGPKKNKRRNTGKRKKHRSVTQQSITEKEAATASGEHSQCFFIVPSSLRDVRHLHGFDVQNHWKQQRLDFLFQSESTGNLPLSKKGQRSDISLRRRVLLFVLHQIGPKRHLVRIRGCVMCAVN